MVRHKIAALLDTVWLPLFLVVSTSWLYAPWLRHVHLGQLDVISAYEATGQPFSGLFRIGDILGALLIVLVVWRVGLLRRQRWLGRALVLVAALTAIDAVWTMG